MSVCITYGFTVVVIEGWLIPLIDYKYGRRAVKINKHFSFILSFSHIVSLPEIKAFIVGSKYKFKVILS